MERIHLCRHQDMLCMQQQQQPSHIVSGVHLSRYSVTSGKDQRVLPHLWAWKCTRSRILSLKIKAWFYLTLQNNQLSIKNSPTAVHTLWLTMALPSFYFTLFFSKNAFLSALFSWKLPIEELHGMLYIDPAPILFYVLKNILKCQVTQQSEVGKDDSPNHTKISNKKKKWLDWLKVLETSGCHHYVAVLQRSEIMALSSQVHPSLSEEGKKCWSHKILRKGEGTASLPIKYGFYFKAAIEFFFFLVLRVI